MSGPHQGAAHREGRAVDVGAFNGVPFGANRTTWNAMVRLIQSHSFQAIGVYPQQIWQDLLPIAEQYGMDEHSFFYDSDATGPSTHLQVGP